MKKQTVLGWIQVLVVIVFVVTIMGLSRRMRLRYQPPSSEPSEEKLLFASTQLLTPQSYQVNFSTTGVVAATTEIEVVPQVGGRIVDVNGDFFAGGRFAADTPLFEIEPVDFELEVQRAKAQVSQAQTQLDLEMAEKAVAEAEWRQFNGEAGIPPLVARTPQIQEARATLAAADAQLASAELALSRTTFTLPKAGRVLESRVSEGQVVRSGQSYGTVFYQDDLEVTASLQGRELEWLYQARDLNVVMQATFRGQPMTYSGILKREAASVNPTSGFADVRFGFEEESVEWVPGVFCHIQVLGPTFDNILLVPVAAVQADGTVWLVDAQDRLVSHTPDVLMMNEQHLAIKGWEEPVKVVDRPLPGAFPGVKIMTVTGEE